MNVFVRTDKAENLWDIKGSFGLLNEKIARNENSFSADNKVVSVSSCVEENTDGVFVRRDKVKNVSAEEVVITSLKSRFSLDGGEYMVYSQYNGWQNESMGGWQELVTSVYACSKSVRNTHSASPFMVLWSKQTNRGTAFHLSAYSAWEMKISRVYSSGESAEIEVELGALSDGLEIRLAPGEEKELPEIIYYQTFNMVDMDCWRLHSYLNKKYPRSTMPVMYNSWLYRFDRFDIEGIYKQIEKAFELGVEYFVIDAGWFGKDIEWWSARGDWTESKDYGFKGRLKDVSQKVKACGMGFGIWLEPECASLSSNAYKENPQYFIEGDGSYFLDFSNSEAVEYILNKVCHVIDTYDVDFVKFDFNADLRYDERKSGFMDYFEGHKRFIESLKNKYPDLYVENCASGGMRMSVRDGKLYDSFWFSDNQSPYYGLRILKDTILRMPPQWIEGWLSVKSIKEFAPVLGLYKYADRIISANDGTWENVAGVDQSFINGFLTGRPLGLSFDLTAISDEVFEGLKEFIKEFKKKREFYKTAVCHILTDTDSLLVLEFRNEDFSDIEIVVFAKKTIQRSACVYPVLDDKATYKLSNGETRYGKNIFDIGIAFDVRQNYKAENLKLEKVSEDE